MNAGMYMEDHMPLGLYIENGKQIRGVNPREAGYGNFYLMPNGVFSFDSDTAFVLERKQYQAKGLQPDFATQSGPMLVIDGKIHPAFNEGSKNKHIRNGVGVSNDGYIVFAISKRRVNFFDFGSLFKEVLNCDNALYLDGAVSKAYIPDINRRDRTGNLGPLVVKLE